MRKEAKLNETGHVAKTRRTSLEMGLVGGDV